MKRETQSRPAASAALSIDALWLDALQRIGARVAHDVKGALNSVSVNVEVVRSRAAKPDAPASAVAKFADTAAASTETVIAMTESLLVLMRAPAESLELGALVRRIGGLLAAAAKSDQGRVELVEPLELLGATTMPGNAARLAVATVLLAATEASSSVTCRARDGALAVETAEGTPVSIDEGVVTALAGSGITIRRDPAGCSIFFPVPQSHETPGRPTTGDR